MYKKIVLIICLFLLSGCQTYYINNMSFEDIVKMVTSSENDLYNINNKGYRYFLPIDFSVYLDKDYNQVFLSHNNKYYMYVDVVSYYYKNTITTDYNYDDYKYYAFGNNGINGYLKITKNNDYFFVELCYNYAIIEVEVEEKDLKYAVSRGMSILSSIKYNDMVIEKYIGDNDLESSETIYNIPTPENKDELDNVLEYIEKNESDEE